MAITKVCYIKPAKMHGLNTTPMLRMKEAASQTFKKGCPVMLTSGYVAKSWAASTYLASVNTIGIVAEDGHNTSAGSDILVIPAKNNILFTGHFYHATAASAVLAQADVGDEMGLVWSATNSVAYVKNLAASSAASEIITIVGLKDAAATAYGRYYFMFNNKCTGNGLF